MSTTETLRNIPAIAVGAVAGLIFIVTGYFAGLNANSPVDGTNYFSRIFTMPIDVLPPGKARFDNALPILFAVTIVILLTVVFTFVYMVLFEGWKQKKNFEKSGMTFAEYNYRSEY